MGCRRLESTADREVESPVGSAISAAAPGRGRRLIETSRSHRQCAATRRLGRTGRTAVETPRRAARSRGRRGCRSRKSLHWQTAERRRRHRRSLNGNRGAGKPVPMRRSRRQQVRGLGPIPGRRHSAAWSRFVLLAALNVAMLVRLRSRRRSQNSHCPGGASSSAGLSRRRLLGDGLISTSSGLSVGVSGVTDRPGGGGRRWAFGQFHRTCPSSPHRVQRTNGMPAE